MFFGSHFEDDPNYVEHIGRDHSFDNHLQSEEDKRPQATFCSMFFHIWISVALYNHVGP